MRYLKAVSLWNNKRREVNTAHVYAVPRRGTAEYNEVQTIMKSRDVPEYEGKKVAAATALEAGKRVKSARALKAEIESRIEKRKAVKPEIYEDFTAPDEKKPANWRENPRVTCEICGAVTSYKNRGRHLKSPKHIDALNKLNKDTTTEFGEIVESLPPIKVRGDETFTQQSYYERAELDLLMELSKRLDRFRNTREDDEL
jgi:hypothetical protein